MVPRSIQILTEMSIGKLPRRTKVVPCLKLKAIPLIVKKIWEPRCLKSLRTSAVC
jgi:hypothetical protein